MNNLKKNLSVPVASFYKMILMGFAMLIMNFHAMAQEGEVDVNLNVDDGGSAWYYNWWIWIGLAIFIIIIVAIVSAGRRR